jgi:hypothetical protein
LTEATSEPTPGGEGHLAGARDPLAVLRDARVIRARCAAITAAVADARSGWFRLDRSRLPEAAARVAATTRRRHPDLDIPIHSRWRHFEAGGVDRKALLDAALAPWPADERVRACLDLAVVSVLLDAGAGAQWRFDEAAATLPSTALPAARASRDDLMAALDAAAGPAAADMTAAAASTAPGVVTGAMAMAAPASTGPATPDPRLARSEGLAVASLHAFLAGVFSATDGQPCRVDAAALRQVDAAVLRGVFQAGPSNPLPGLEGRAALLQRLGQTLQREAERDGVPARPSLLLHRLTRGGARGELAAAEMLRELLRLLGPIWRSGSVVMGVPAGDVWPHRFAGGADGRGGDDPVTRGWVPFHKLTQWLCYSLLEPLHWAGIEVSGLDALTGLPEYRNGGLLIDTGVLVPRSGRAFERVWKPGDEFIVEWRALTVTLLDELATQVRAELGVNAARLPLARVLEGGTWVCGRELAAELRDGAPPLRIDSDGTLF